MNLSYERVKSLGDVPFHDTCIVIADENLPAELLQALPDPILVEPGEQLKALVSIEQLAGRVLERCATKPLTLVAAGGGSVGDAVGFLASVLWRGVNLWHIPTTLLAMIDSAHGGKTAVNLPNAKNQLGTFHFSERTFLVDEILRNLPLRIRRDGLSELLKVFLLSDRVFFETLPSFEELANRPFAEIEERFLPLIEKAIMVKLDIVRTDPFEREGVRAYLNLGHTLGHALERTMDLSHGASIAWGLAATVECSRRFGMTNKEADSILCQLYPLLEPIPDEIDREAVYAALRLDKKTQNNKLRSVILEKIRHPKLTERLTIDDWLDALEQIQNRVRSRPVHVYLKTPAAASIALDASKSEMNRALIIAALRSGATSIEGVSGADDVRNLYRALVEMGFAVTETASGYRSVRDQDIRIPERARVNHCGQGGTTFRFLHADAASLPREPILHAAPDLLRRPHEPLIDALKAAGAEISPYSSGDGTGYRIAGWNAIPGGFSVDASLSSQFVSALALLAAGSESPFTIRLQGEIVSEPYLEMTLAMLERAGGEVLYQNGIIALNPSPRLSLPLELRIAPDASSAAVWHVARSFGHPVEIASGGETLQPDARIDEFLRMIEEADSEAEISLTSAPDLLPVLTVAAIRKGRRIRFTGIERLKHKESDRLDGFADSLRAIGIPILRIDDAFVTPGAEEIALKPDIVFNTHGDHRIVMAGVLLSMILGSVALDNPWAVTKSYPSFWNDAREAGWSALPCKGVQEGEEAE